MSKNVLLFGGIGGDQSGLQNRAVAVDALGRLIIGGTPGAFALVTPTEAVTVLVAATVTPVSAVDVYFSKGWFYPYKAFVAGVPTVNAAAINIGKSATYLPDVLNPGDGPILIEAPAGQVFSLKNINIKGGIGDGVFYSIS